MTEKVKQSIKDLSSFSALKKLKAASMQLCFQGGRPDFVGTGHSNREKSFGRGEIEALPPPPRIPR